MGEGGGKEKDGKEISDKAQGITFKISQTCKRSFFFSKIRWGSTFAFQMIIARNAITHYTACSHAGTRGLFLTAPNGQCPFELSAL